VSKAFETPVADEVETAIKDTTKKMANVGAD